MEGNERKTRGNERKGNEWEQKETKGNDRRGNERKRKDRKGKGKETKRKERKRKEMKGKKTKGIERQRKETEGNERKGKETKGNGRERKGRNGNFPSLPFFSFSSFFLLSFLFLLFFCLLNPSLLKRSGEKEKKGRGTFLFSPSCFLIPFSPPPSTFLLGRGEQRRKLSAPLVNCRRFEPGGRRLKCGK